MDTIRDTIRVGPKALGEPIETQIRAKSVKPEAHFEANGFWKAELPNHIKLEALVQGQRFF